MNFLQIILLISPDLGSKHASFERHDASPHKWVLSIQASRLEWLVATDFILSTEETPLFSQYQGYDLVHRGRVIYPNRLLGVVGHRRPGCEVVQCPGKRDDQCMTCIGEHTLRRTYMTGCRGINYTSSLHMPQAYE